MKISRQKKTKKKSSTQKQAFKFNFVESDYETKKNLVNVEDDIIAEN